MIDPEQPEIREMRDYWKEMHRIHDDVEPMEVVLAATDIYQDEYGHMFEDEAWDGLSKEAATLFLKHRDTAKDNSELVDKIVADLHGDTPTVFEQISEESARGDLSPAAGKI